VPATTVEPSYYLGQEIKVSQAIDALAADMKHRIICTPIVVVPDLQRIDELEEESPKEWKVTAGVLTYEGRIYEQKDDILHNKDIRFFQHNPECGPFGARKPAELVSQDFSWPAMDASVQQYIAACELCHRNKAPWHAHHGTNMPLTPSSRPWEGVTMDCITDLSQSTINGYTGMLIIIDRLTKMAIYHPWRKDIDSPELEQMFFEQVMWKPSVPDNIVSDRAKEFTR
jgi:hypothetical protein